jgi:2-methylcitrate dehydratase PrpD
MSAVDAILDASLAKAPDDARAVMRLSLIDWMACGLAGQGEPVSRMTRALVEDEAGAAQATVFGGGRFPARAAALANGATSHALDYDDTHFAHIGHPSVAVIPAALAMAERQGAGFDVMLNAALAGCEASVRFGRLFGRSHYQQGFHQTATAGAFGAAVAACQVLGLDRAMLGQALGLVTTRASGLKSQFGTMGKPFNAGIAAANGVEAALLAAQGFVSNPDALDGVNGFVGTHHCDGSAEQPAGFLMETVSHKFHACCHGLHATLEALQSLGPIPPEDVTAVHITTHPRWMTVCNQPAPDTGLGAKFSYRTVAAFGVLEVSTAGLDTFDDEKCNLPQVVALRDRVTVTADDNLTEMQAHVKVYLGQSPREAFHDLDAPLALQDRRARIRTKAAALLGKDRAARLAQAIGDQDIGALTALMAA